MPWQAPRLALGVRLGDALAAAPATQQPGVLAALAAALRAERFLLTWRPGAAWVVLRAGATPCDALRAARLAATLAAQPAAEDGAAMRTQLVAALLELDVRFAEFEAALLQHGWSMTPLLPVEASSARLLDCEGDTAGTQPQRELATAAAAEQPRREA
jgi:hypothetical protein